MRLCEACGSFKVTGSVGGTSLCSSCTADIEVEIKALHAAGKPVNVSHIARRMFKAMEPAPETYLLRDIPPALMDRVKHRAIDDGGSIRDVILTALHKYVGTK